MKFFIAQFVLICFLMLNSISVLGQKQTLFVDSDYNAALQEAKREKKPLVVMFYATWCAHCNKMKNEIFVDTTVANFYKKSFVCMAVDAETAVGIQLKDKFQNKFKIRSYPTFAFLDTNENLLYCTAGEFKTDVFITEGKNVLLPENQMGTIKDKFNADVSNADNCLKYISILRKAGFDATEVTRKYLKTKTKDELFTELNWRIMANGINDFDSEEFKFITNNREAFGKAASPTRVDKKIIFMVSETFKSYAEKLDSVNFNKRRPIAQSYQIRKVDSLVFRYDLQLSEGLKAWKNYQKAAETNIEKFGWKDTNLINEIASNYLEFINDKKGLLNAVKWCNQSISLSPSLDKYILTSKLLIKAKEYNQASEFLQNSKSIAQNFGWKTDELDKLLSETKKH